MSLQDMVTLNAWATMNGYRVRVHGEGQHWCVERDGFTAEWWPSSAKLVINKGWQGGIHCHDVGQVIEEIGRVMEGA
jgi:hypothetical protein